MGRSLNVLNLDCFSEFEPDVAEGVAVLSQLLARGITVRVLPRQVVQLYKEHEYPFLSFVHGVPDLSSLSSAFLCRDRRIMRGLIQSSSRIKAARGASFSYNSVGMAVKYAQSLKLPIVVRDQEESSFDGAEYVVDSIASLRIVLKNNRTLTPAQLEYIGGNRPGYARRGYSLVKTAGESSAMLHVQKRPEVRFLLEERPRGRHVRALVSGEEVLGSISWPEFGSGDAVVDDRLDDAVKDAALSSMACIPGLFSGSVDMILGREGASRPEDISVLEVYERLRIFPVLSENSEAPLQIIKDMVNRAVNAAGVSFPRQDPVTDVRVRCKGAGVYGQKLVECLSLTCSRRGVSVSGVQLETNGVVTATLSGSPLKLALLAQTVTGDEGVARMAAFIEFESPRLL